MGGIYPGLRTGATFILLTGAVAALAPQEWLWSQPRGMTAGDHFLALGYERGVELWDWPPDSLPRINTRWPGPAATALWAEDSTLYWCAADSSLRTATHHSSGWQVTDVHSLGATGTALSGSELFVAMVTDASDLRWAPRPLDSSPPVVWSPPGNRPLAYVSIRDSTAAVAGADRAYLVRLRNAEAVLLDSLALGAFVQSVEWAGDSLYMGFGFSGLKMVVTAGDRFVDTLSSWTSQGTYGRIVLTDRACAGLDFFGRMEIFERGLPFKPNTRLTFDGTLRTAVGRTHEIVVLTVERGLSILNLFTPSSPFWSHHSLLPGFVRDLEKTQDGVFAFADFSGVYRLSPGEPLVVHHPYNAMSLDIEDTHLAATSFLGGVGVATLSSVLNAPYAVVRTSGQGQKSVICGDRLFVVGDGLCDDALFVYQLSPPVAPVELRTVQLCGTISDLAAGPGVVAVAIRDSGLLVLDGQFPGTPLATLASGETWDQLTWDSSDLWGRNRSNQLARWWWDGVALHEQNRIQVASVSGFDVWQSTLVTADSSRALKAWNWRTGSQVDPLDSMGTRYVVTHVLVTGDTVWAVDRDVVLRFEVRVPAAVREPLILPRRIVLDQPYPNPFNGRLSLYLHLEPGPWSVTILDLLGRKVESWRGTALAPGPHRLVWIPENAGPRASGLYFVRAENGEHSQTRRVVYMK